MIQKTENLLATISFAVAHPVTSGGVVDRDVVGCSINTKRIAQVLMLTKICLLSDWI